MKPRIVKVLVPLLLYAALTIGFFWPLLPRLASGLHDRSDTVLNTWIIGWQAHILPIAPLSVFDAPIFHPLHNTLALSEILWPAAPAAVPLALATQAPLLVYNLLFLASFVLAGFGAYLLALHVTGSRPGALLAGIIYAFSPHQFTHLSQLQLLSIGWLPLMLLFLDRFWEQGRPRDGLLLALTMAAQALSAFYYAFQVVLVVGLFLVYRLVVPGAPAVGRARPAAEARPPGALGSPGHPARLAVHFPLFRGAQPVGSAALAGRNLELCAAADRLRAAPGRSPTLRLAVAAQATNWVRRPLFGTCPALPGRDRCHRYTVRPSAAHRSAICRPAAWQLPARRIITP